MERSCAYRYAGTGKFTPTPAMMAILQTMMDAQALVKYRLVSSATQCSLSRLLRLLPPQYAISSVTSA